MTLSQLHTHLKGLWQHCQPPAAGSLDAPRTSMAGDSCSSRACDSGPLLSASGLVCRLPSFSRGMSFRGEPPRTTWNEDREGLGGNATSTSREPPPASRNFGTIECAGCPAMPEASPSWGRLPVSCQLSTEMEGEARARSRRDEPPHNLCKSVACVSWKHRAGNRPYPSGQAEAASAGKPAAPC